MRTLIEIQAKCAEEDIEFSSHALEKMAQRDILSSEVLEAMANAQCLEAYPDDKYGPSMLVLGFTADNRPLHILVSTMEERNVKVITTYQPNPLKWINFRERKA